MKLEARPIELSDANTYVSIFHRHHPPVYRDKFRVAAFDGTKVVGVVQVARPVSRILDDGMTVEVVRLCTDGTKNVCSFLYSKVARVAKELGYKRIITYILENESGSSLKAAGWKFCYISKGHKWTCPSRPRKTISPECNKQLWEKDLRKDK